MPILTTMLPEFGIENRNPVLYFDIWQQSKKGMSVKKMEAAR